MALYFRARVGPFSYLERIESQPQPARTPAQQRADRAPIPMVVFRTAAAIGAGCMVFVAFAIGVMIYLGS